MNETIRRYTAERDVIWTHMEQAGVEDPSYSRYLQDLKTVTELIGLEMAQELTRRQIEHQQRLMNGFMNGGFMQ